MSETVLDDFADLTGWMPIASGLARLAIAPEAGPHGMTMRLDFDFRGGGGFVVARKELSLSLPESYEFRFDIRGSGPRNTLEFKLSDPGGQNVWWSRYQDFELPSEWRPMRIDDGHIAFAWGPAGGGTPAAIGAIELVIAAGTGGSGSVWIDALRLEDRSARPTPTIRASSSLPGHPPESVLDGSPTTSWRSDATDAQWLLIDLQAEREYGGVVIRWEHAGRARDFRVRTSDDGVAWQDVRSTRQADSDCSYLFLPGTVSRYLRIDLDAAVEGRGFGIREVELKPPAFSRSVHAFFQSVAADAPRGAYPKYLSWEQTYWSPVGVPDGDRCALLNEEGMVEVGRGAFSIEPFLFVDERLITWADAETSPALEDECLPIPSSVWRAGDVTLGTTAYARRTARGPVLCIRYRVENAAFRRRPCRLFAAIRPFQVTPPWQAFGEIGGVSPITQLDYASNVVWVNGTRAVVTLARPRQFGAIAFEHGALTTYLHAGQTPVLTEVRDAVGWASGVLRFDLEVAPSASADVYLAVPFDEHDRAATEPVVTIADAAAAATAFGDAVNEWTALLAPVEIRLPASARDHVHSMRTAIGHILLQRDGPALQPGPRRYARSWIRDGAVMAAALLRTGRSEEARAFVRWYARYQAADGAVPCCVDRDGPDPLVEHDSHGEFVVTVMECFRFTRDQAFLAELWPAVLKALRHLEVLRATRLVPEFETPERRARYGLLPESVSHEGYMAHPVHSYWDDFWALRAFTDAAEMAAVLGDEREARRFAAQRDAFRADIQASIAQTMAERAIDYLPASVEWADFDPTATANAITLLDVLADLPRAAVVRTFDEYLKGFRERRDGAIDWAKYTPYEIRNVGALVRLGERGSANEVLDFLVADRRPPQWNQWPEIAWRDPKSPGHLGDVPHGWIGAEYVLAFRSLFAFERASDRSLVLAAGIRGSWLDDGITVRNLPTYFGALDFTLRRSGPAALAFELGGGVEVPGGTIVVQPPLPRPLVAVEIDGRRVDTFDGETVTLDRGPAAVVMRY